MTQPAERLGRPQFLSPPVIDGSSKSGQFAGRTLLASGSATVTVSTTNAKSDMVLKSSIEAALAAAFSTQGRIAVNSGSASGVASTTAVYSGDVIQLSQNADVAQSSGQGRGFRVSSIVDGVSFNVLTEDAQAVSAGNASVMWKILGRDPSDICVKSINPGNHFILGWADGVARPYDCQLHWEILRTS